MRALCVSIILLMCLSLGYVSFYTGKGSALSNATAAAMVDQKQLESNIAEATFDVTIYQGHVLAEFDRQVIAHCDSTVAAFMSNKNVDVKLELLFIPKVHAMRHYDKKDKTTLIWQIPAAAPSGAYTLSIHVLNACHSSAESVHVGDAMVEIGQSS